jgi:Protein of unknown function (DUF3485)
MNHATIEDIKKTRDRFSKFSRPVVNSEWRRVALICMLLVVSGAIRYWRIWEFQSLARESQMSPFPLSELPKELGGWLVREGSEATLEPEIARLAGASDHLIRTYFDQNSGEGVVVLIIYGLATKGVSAHVPDICYPSQGFKQVSTTDDVDIPVPGTSTVARFRRQSFAKNRPGGRDFREVYHSFLNAGEWGVDTWKNWKKFRYQPAMFKVQVQSQSPRSSIESENNSLDQFLGLIVREINQRVAEKH